MAGTIATDGERRAIAARIRERGLSECADMAYALGNGCKVGARCEDCRDWMAERLARLVEPQADRDALLTIADRVERLSSDPSRCGSEACAYFRHPDCDCDGCAAYSSDEPCLDLAAKDAARRIRDAVDACEGDSDAPAACDKEQTATDAHADGNEAADGARATSMDVLRWVKDHGGLDAVRKSVEQSECRKKLLDCFAMRLGFESLEDSGDIFKELEKRLMPEGMEWPRFEDGEPVRPGDKLLDKDGDWFEAVSFVFTCDWWGIMGYQAEGFGDLSRETRRKLDGMAYGTRVKRPAPKVLDADGAEICVGDTVYHVKDGSEMTVYGIEGEWLIVSVGGRVRHDVVTHRAPVLAVDGEPLEAGQTVYAKNYGYVKCTVLTIEWVVDGYLVEVENEGGHKFRQTPDEFTHQRPVLDAEGNRIEPAMDVWWVCEGDERGIHAEKLHVESIGEDGFVTCNPFNYGTWVELEPSELYVHKPVLAADGKPLREGETVYKVGGDGTAYVFDGMSDNIDGLAMLHHDGKPYIGTGLRVDQLTHERPDSWERLEEDAGKNPFDYCKDVGHRLDTCENSEAYKARDLVRRARALAGVSE